MNIKDELLKLSDSGYRDFHSNLMPTIDKNRIIGIRTPVLRKFAKDIKKRGIEEEFLKILPHYYYEENNLHAFLIEGIKDFERAMFETERFLPYIDNWATCDSFFPPVFKKYPERMLSAAKSWISSDKVYTVRYGIGVFMKLFLDENYKKEYLSRIASVQSEEYYINMMIAWYFATALFKQYDDAVLFFEERKLPLWVHNKAIQKAVESRRISDDKKLYLKSLKEVKK